MVLLVFLSPFFIGQSEAARNVSGRFRGKDYSDFLKYKEELQKKTLPRYSSLRRFVRIPVPNISVVSPAETVQSTLPSRRFGTRGFSTSPAKTVSTGDQSTQEFRDYSAEAVSFRLTVPEKFALKSDTLDWESGTLLFQQGNAKIEVIATSQKCEGGLTFVRSCVEKKAEAFLEDFKQELPRMQLQENKNISLNQNETQVKKSSLAHYTEMSAWNYEAVQLTFFDPINEYMWLLRVTDPGKITGIVSNNRALQRMFSSIIAPFSTSETTNVSRTMVSTNPLSRERNKNVGKTLLSKSLIRFDSSQIEEVGAVQIPFILEVPNGFELINNTLSWNEGELLLESSDTLFHIQASDQKCEDQTPRLKRACIEDYAAERTKELKEEFPESNVLQDQNMQLQLIDINLLGKDNTTRKTFARDAVGRMLLLRMAGKRVGLLTFTEPVHDFLWTIRIEAPETKEGFLNDVRQKQKVFSSLQFHPTEEDVNWEPEEEGNEE